MQVVGLVAVRFAHVQDLGLRDSAGWVGRRALHADGLAFCAAPVGVNGRLTRAQSGRAPAAVSGNSGVQRSRARVSRLIQWHLSDFPEKSEQGRKMRVYAVSTECRSAAREPGPGPGPAAAPPHARARVAGAAGSPALQTAPPRCSPTRQDLGVKQTPSEGHVRAAVFDLGTFPNLGRRNEGRMSQSFHHCPSNPARAVIHPCSE